MSEYKAGDLAAYFAARNKDVNSKKLTKGGRKVANLLSEGMQCHKTPDSNLELIKKQSVLLQEDKLPGMKSPFSVRKNQKKIKEENIDFSDSPYDEDSIVEQDFQNQPMSVKKRKSIKLLQQSSLSNVRPKKRKNDVTSKNIKKIVGDSTLQFGSIKKKKKNSVPGLKNEPELMKFSRKKEEHEEQDEENVMSDDHEENVMSDDHEENVMSDDHEENSHKVKKSNEAKAMEKIEEDKKTVFFGNIPLHMNKGEVANVFRNYGDVKSVRFRSYIPVKANTPRKFAERRKECHGNVTAHMGFVVFASIEDAENALKLNGIVVNGNHIRVDRANSSPGQKPDHESSVFVGNIPFTVSDEAMWEKFSPCGEIVCVRVIRDKITGLGKGFAYVQFKDKSSVQKALQLTDTNMECRAIRVKLCEYNTHNKLAWRKGDKNKEKTRGKFGERCAWGKGDKNKERFGGRKQVKSFIKFGGSVQKKTGKGYKDGDERPNKPRFNFRKKKNDLGISQESRKSLKKMKNKKMLERKKDKIAAILKQSINSSGTISKLKTTKSSM